jgi:hypothetical protein
VLNGKLALFDVRDTEGLASKALDDQLRSMGARLGELEHEDALAYLVGTVWEASTRFDPQRSVASSTTPTRSAGDARSTGTAATTGGRVGRSRTRRSTKESNPPSYRSRKAPTAEMVNWTGLSTTARTNLKLAVLISNGFLERDVALVYGMSLRSVKLALRELREEIREQSTKL